MIIIVKQCISNNAITRFVCCNLHYQKYPAVFENIFQYNRNKEKSGLITLLSLYEMRSIAWMHKKEYLEHLIAKVRKISTAPPDAAPERSTERCALICEMKFTPLVFNLECMVYVQTTGQNFTEVLSGAHFLCHKVQQSFIILVSYCSRMQFCSIKFMSDDILILIHVQLGLWLFLSE